MKLLSQSYVFKTLRAMQKNLVLCDLELVADDGERVFVHSLIWVAAFEYNEQYVCDLRSFHDTMKTLDLPGVNGSLLHDVVDFIYGENVEIGKLLEITNILKRLGMKNGQICLDGCPLSDVKITTQDAVNVNTGSNHDNNILQRRSPSSFDVSTKCNPCNNISNVSVDKTVKVNPNHDKRELKRRTIIKRKLDCLYSSNNEMNSVKIDTRSDHDTVTVKVEYDLPEDTESEQLKDTALLSKNNNIQHIKLKKSTLVLKNDMYSPPSQSNIDDKDFNQQKDSEIFDIKCVKVEPLSPTEDNQSDFESDQCDYQTQLMITNTFSLQQMENNMNPELNYFSDEMTECSCSDGDKQNSKSIHQHETPNQASPDKKHENIESKDKVEIVTLAAFVPVNPEQNNGKYRQIAPNCLMPSNVETVNRQIAPKCLTLSSGKTVNDQNTTLKLSIQRLSCGNDTSSKKSSTEKTKEKVKKSSVKKTDGYPTKTSNKSPNKTDKTNFSSEHANSNHKKQNSGKRGRPRGSTQKFMMDSMKHRKIISPKQDKQQNQDSIAVTTSMTPTNISSPPVAMTSTSCQPIAIRPATNKPVTITSMKSENTNSGTSVVVPPINLRMDCNTYTCNSNVTTPVVSSMPVVGNVVMPQVPTQLGTSNCFIFGQRGLSVNPVLQPVNNYIQTQNLVPQSYNIPQMPVSYPFMQNDSTINTSASSSSICTPNSILVQNQQSVLAGNQNLRKLNTLLTVPQPVQLFQNQCTAQQNTSSTKQTTTQKILLPKPNLPSVIEQKPMTEKYILPKQNPTISGESQQKLVVSNKKLRRSLSKINSYKKLAADKMKKARLKEKKKSDKS